MLFFSSSSSRNDIKFEMTGAEHADNLGLLSRIKLMKYTCLAMWYMTNEVFYREASVIVKKGLKKLKKILKHGQRRYSRGGKLHRAILDFEDFLPAYKMTELQIELKMHPSRTEEVIRKMLDLDISQQPIDMKFVTVRKH